MSNLAIQPQHLEITTEHINKFAQLIGDGVEAWVKAGKLLVQMVERNPNTYAIILKECPHLSPDTLIAFEKIGRQEIYPYLLLEKCPGATKLVELPYGLQNKYYKESVDVLVGWSNGNPVVEKKYLRQMDKAEATRVFHPKGVRTIDEQREFLPPPTKQTDSKPHRKSSFEVIGHYKLVQDKGIAVRLVKVIPVECIGVVEIGRSARGGIESAVFEVRIPSDLADEANEFKDVDKETKSVASPTDKFCVQQIQDMEIELKRARESLEKSKDSVGRKKLTKIIAGLLAEINSLKAQLD